ncbi:hypothetical protein M8C21_008091, partial [Ambrosia artemisiifolia]
MMGMEPKLETEMGLPWVYNLIKPPTGGSGEGGGSGEDRSGIVEDRSGFIEDEGGGSGEGGGSLTATPLLPSTTVFFLTLDTVFLFLECGESTCLAWHTHMEVGEDEGYWL